MTPHFDSFSGGRRERSFLPTFIVSAGLGIAAGAVGTLLVLAYVAPALAPSGIAFSLRPDRTRAETEASAVVLESAARAAAWFAIAKPEGFSPLFGAYAPGDAVGSGIALTSDGWLVTHAATVAKAKRPQDLVAVIGGRAYPVRRAISDPYADIAFLKIDAANLPVVAFGDASGLDIGQWLYAPDAAGGFRRLPVTGRDAAPAENADGIVRSAERIGRLIRTASAADVLPGTMLVGANGKVVGIAAGSGKFGLQAVPVDAFEAVIGDVLRDKAPNRPVLGLNYAELSLVPVRAGQALARGALVAASPDGRRPALTRRGPAEAAGIRAGDVITAVDGDPVSAKRLLSDALAEYQPGETVTVSVVRAGSAQELRIDVTLGASAGAAP